MSRYSATESTEITLVQAASVFEHKVTCCFSRKKKKRKKQKRIFIQGYFYGSSIVLGLILFVLSPFPHPSLFFFSIEIYPAEISSK